MLGPLEDELGEPSSPLPPARREQLKMIHRNALRLLKLVNTLLDFSSISIRDQQLKFDLLIIDEASQMRPEDALGAIARSRQCVVVGDSNQLPPTSFFERLGIEEDQAERDAVIHEAESILETAASLYRPPRRLKWHYRSQHESLIAFSNAEFYQNSLVVFPSPHGDSPEYGVRLHEVDGGFSGGKNEREARGVVEAALTHLKTRPGETLGIVAMNRDQANLIEELFEKLIKSDPIALKQREALDGRHERVFVKNLENVQGDERDVIIISITYGPDEIGVVKKNFGPINLSTGWRRLNVLFTRARRRVEVFFVYERRRLEFGPWRFSRLKKPKELPRVREDR